MHLVSKPFKKIHGENVGSSTTIIKSISWYCLVTFRMQITHLSLSIITLHIMIQIAISTKSKLQGSMVNSDGTEMNAALSRENNSGKSRNEIKGGSEDEEDADHETNHENRMITSTPTRESARNKRSSSKSDSRKMKHVKRKRIKNKRHHGYRILYAKDVVSSNC